MEYVVLTGDGAEAFTARQLAENRVAQLLALARDAVPPEPAPAPAQKPRSRKRSSA